MSLSIESSFKVILAQLCSVTFLQSICIADKSSSAVPIVYPARDVRRHLRPAVLVTHGRGTDPRFPQWSLGCPGYDDAERSVRIFGAAPVRKIKAEVNTRVYSSSVPFQQAISDVGETINAPWSSRKVVQKFSASTQTPLGAFRSPVNGFFVARPSRELEYNQKQKKRQRLRMCYFNFLKDSARELMEFSLLHPEMAVIHTLPFYREKPGTKRRKFPLQLISHSLSLISLLRNCYHAQSQEPRSLL